MNINEKDLLNRILPHKVWVVQTKEKKGVNIQTMWVNYFFRHGSESFKIDL